MKSTDNNNSEQDLYNDEYFNNLPSKSKRIEIIDSYLSLDNNDRVCEFGCGVGDVLFYIQAKIKYGLGVDFSTSAISEANKRKRSKKTGKLDFIKEDIRCLGQKEGLNGSFDKVLLLDVTEHVDDKLLTDFLHSARQLLSAEGRLIIHTPNLDYYLERMKQKNFILQQYPGHIAVRNFEQYKILLDRSGFKIVNSYRLPHYHKWLGRIDRLLIKSKAVKKYFESRLLIVACLDDN